MHEDVVVIRSLYQSGAQAMVLMSNADVLVEADRERVVEYALTHLHQQLGTEVQVYLVGVRPPEDRLARKWIDRVLMPMLVEHRRLN